MAVRRWQDQYLQAGADDSEYDYVDSILMNCPDCFEWGNEGWVAVPVQVSEDDWDQTQEECSRCFGTGRILED